MSRLSRLRRIGWLLDSSIPIPGTRYTLGIDQIVGLVPGIGDLVGGFLSLYIIVEAARLGVPRGLLAVAAVMEFEGEGEANDACPRDADVGIRKPRVLHGISLERDQSRRRLPLN